MLVSQLLLVADWGGEHLKKRCFAGWLPHSLAISGSTARMDLLHPVDRLEILANRGS